MSAQPIRKTVTAPPLVAVPNQTQVERFGILVAMRNQAQRAWNFLAKHAKVGWNWVREHLHLDAILDAGKSVVGWVVDKARFAVQAIGLDGIVGAVLTGITSPRVRAFLNDTVGRALRWVGQGITWVHEKIVAGLNHLGTPGRWLAARLDDVFSFFAGRGNGDTEYGVINKIKQGWRWLLAYDNARRNVLSKTLRTAGIWLLGNRGLWLALGMGLPLPLFSIGVIALLGYSLVSLNEIRVDVKEMREEEKAAAAPQAEAGRRHGDDAGGQRHGGPVGRRCGGRGRPDGDPR